MKKYLMLFVLIAFQLEIINLYAQNTVNLSSPDKSLHVKIQAGKTLAQLVNYDLNYNNQPVLKNAGIGFSLQNNLVEAGWQLSKIKRSYNNKVWQDSFGERKNIPDKYYQLELLFTSSKSLEARLLLVFRAYNEGVAYQYTIIGHQNDSLVLDKEYSDFRFSKNATTWTTTTAQGLYTEKKINEVSGVIERPLTVKMNTNNFVAIGEAGLTNFARMKFSKSGENTLSSILDGNVKFASQLQSPWRYILAGKSAPDLLSKNYLLLNLNEPSKIKNTSWIKPGKVIREVTLTTKGALATIDFAAANGLQYIMFDAGWYGREDHDTSNATRVSHDPRSYRGPLDMQQVIDYGKKNNIGLILYVNRRSLERQLDSLLPLYQKWGVKGLKFGFVNVGSQYWTNWLHEAVAKAAKYNMVVDIHDEYRPTGVSRTYPNLLTQEGIRGDEEAVKSDQVLVTIFSRMIAGAGDQTNCYFTDRPEKMGSHATQLAKTICIFSPLQFLFWYDRPAQNPADTSEQKLNGFIRNVQELEFFKSLPTVWDDTRILEGEIGKYVTIARRKNEDWFIGSINGSDDRQLTIDFNFLGKQKKYKASIYSDDPASASITKVKVDEKIITSNSRLTFPVNKNNGLAIQIVSF